MRYVSTPARFLEHIRRKMCNVDEALYNKISSCSCVYAEKNTYCREEKCVTSHLEQYDEAPFPVGPIMH
jgi:hypothetical protein